MLALSSVSVLATLEAYEKTTLELKNAGLSEPSILGLSTLSKKFATSFPSVSKTEKDTETFIENFRIECDNFISQMSQADKDIYNDYRMRNGMGSD